MSYMKLPHNHHNEIDNTELLEQLNDVYVLYEITT